MTRLSPLILMLLLCGCDRATNTTSQNDGTINRQPCFVSYFYTTTNAYGDRNGYGFGNAKIVSPAIKDFSDILEVEHFLLTNAVVQTPNACQYSVISYRPF